MNNTQQEGWDKIRTFELRAKFTMTYAKSRLGFRIPRKLKKLLKNSVTHENMQEAMKIFDMSEIKLIAGFNREITDGK